MNAAAVFTILEKGLAILPTLITAGAEVIPLIERMHQVSVDAKAGKHVDAATLDALEADLDTALADFNTPMT